MVIRRRAPGKGIGNFSRPGSVIAARNAPVLRFGSPEAAGREGWAMRFGLMSAVGACLLAMSMTADATPATTSGVRADQHVIRLAQAEPKKETVTHKVKRKVKSAWRSLTGYKFEVNCPFSKTTCTETGKDVNDARGKCIAGHPLCLVSDTK
jgi:hypothetical protein